MSASTTSGVIETIDQEIITMMKASLDDQPNGLELWQGLGDEHQKLLLSAAVSRIRETCYRCLSAATEKGDLPAMSLLTVASVVRAPSRVSYVDSGKPVMTGIKTKVILEVPLPQGPEAPSLSVEVHTLLDRFKAPHLQEFLIDNMIRRSIVESSNVDFITNKFSSEALRDMIEKSPLSGFDESIQPIIRALGEKPHILSKAGTFDKVVHENVQDIGLELLSVNSVKSQNRGPWVALSLRLSWQDDTKTSHTRPEFSMILSRYGPKLFHILPRTETYWLHHTEIIDHGTKQSQFHPPRANPAVVTDEGSSCLSGLKISWTHPLYKAVEYFIHPQEANLAP